MAHLKPLLDGGWFDSLTLEFPSISFPDIVHPDTLLKLANKYKVDMSACNGVE